MIFGRFGLPRKKKAYVRLTQDYDALDVANRIGPSVGFFFTMTAWRIMDIAPQKIKTYTETT